MFFKKLIRDQVENKNTQFIKHLDDIVSNTFYLMIKNIQGNSFSVCSEILNLYTKNKNRKWGLRFFFLLSEIIQKIAFQSVDLNINQSNFQRLQNYLLKKFGCKKKPIYYYSKIESLNDCDQQLLDYFKGAQSFNSKQNTIEKIQCQNSLISIINYKSKIQHIENQRKNFIALFSKNKINIQQLLINKQAYQNIVLDYFKNFEKNTNNETSESQMKIISAELQFANDVFEYIDEFFVKQKNIEKNYKLLKTNIKHIYKKYYPKDQIFATQNLTQIQSLIEGNQMLSQKIIPLNITNKNFSTQQDLNKYLGRNIRKRSKQKIPKVSVKYKNTFDFSGNLNSFNDQNKSYLNNKQDNCSYDVETTLEPKKRHQQEKNSCQIQKYFLISQPQLILILLNYFVMEFLRNQIIQFLLKIFIAMMVMDVLSRTFLNPKKLIKPQKSQIKNQEIFDEKKISPKVKENIGSIDDLNDMNIKNQTDYLGDPKQVINLNIQICKSCGYKKNFEELKNFLESQIQNLHVVSEEYPIPMSKNLLAKILFYVQMGLMLLMMCGNYIFQKLQIREPEIYRRAQQNKMMVIFGLYFIGNTIQNFLTNSGAFEVYFNNSLIYSKLQQGTFPDHFYILSQLKSFFYQSKQFIQQLLQR